MGVVNNLTMTYNNLRRVITTPVDVINPLTGQQEKTYAIWDTGASQTVITKQIADTLGLEPTGMIDVQGVHSIEKVNTHFIELVLNNDQIRLKLVVTECPSLSADESIGGLIGMDVISQGDFAITNFNAKTTMTFRKPSVQHIDFCKMKETPIVKTAQPGRNDPCPCGSGKKYKKCCGIKK
jgi:predicted aspartyl protease